MSHEAIEIRDLQQPSETEDHDKDRAPEGLATEVCMLTFWWSTEADLSVIETFGIPALELPPKDINKTVCYSWEVRSKCQYANPICWIGRILY